MNLTELAAGLVSRASSAQTRITRTPWFALLWFTALALSSTACVAPSGYVAAAGGACSTPATTCGFDEGVGVILKCVDGQWVKHVECSADGFCMTSDQSTTGETTCYDPNCYDTSTMACPKLRTPDPRSSDVHADQ